MTEQKIALTKQEKKAIKDSSETDVMSKEEWAIVQGMTHSELRRDSSVCSFLNELEDKYK